MRVIPIIGLICCVACAQPASQEAQTDPAAPKTAESSPNKGVQKVASLSLDEMKAADSEYLVPSPGEVLSSLDKLDRVAWSNLASYETKADYDDKYTRALNLGVRVADAFMAVNARDAARFGEMSTIIFDLAREIGLGDVLEGQRNQLDNLAAEGKWDELRAALDNVQNDVRMEVEAMGEDELVVLASAGGWMEGMRVVTAHLKDNYSEDKAELLQQARLIEYFLNKLQSMPEAAAAHPLVKSTEQTLQTLLPFVADPTRVNAQVAQDIYQATGVLVAEVEEG